LSLKQRVDRLGGTQTISMWPDGLTDILPQEDWVAILSAPDQDAELLRRCPNYYALTQALKAAPADRNGVRRLRV
jgi:hypothetical protein